MKNFYFFLFLYITYQSTAQTPYELFNSKSEFFFNQSNVYTELLGLKTDSTKINSTDSIYYHYRILATTTGTACAYNARSASWLGKKTIRKNNNDYIFFNQQNDTLIIKPSMPINGSWVYYTYPNGNYLKATVSSKQYEATFNGLFDTVKTITFQAYNSFNAPVFDPYTTKAFKIAKTQGIIRLGNIYNFPADTSINKRCDGKRLTFGDLYDHAVGDVLQTYKYNGVFTQNMPPYSYTIEYTTYTYLTKINPTPNSAVFTVNRTVNTAIYSYYYPPQNTSAASIQTITINNLDSLLVKEMPQQYHELSTMPNFSNGGAPGFLCYPTSSVNSCKNFRMDYAPCSGLSGQSDTCLGFSEAECMETTSYFGMGQYDHTEQTGPLGDPRQDYYPIYFKSANCTFGIFNAVGIKEYSLKSELQISPNPARENIKFEFSTKQKILEITVTNILGKLVLSISDPDNSSLNVSSLENGIYFVKIKTDRGEVSNKFIKE